MFGGRDIFSRFSLSLISINLEKFSTITKFWSSLFILNLLRFGPAREKSQEKVQISNSKMKYSDRSMKVQFPVLTGKYDSLTDKQTN